MRLGINFGSLDSVRKRMRAPKSAWESVNGAYVERMREHRKLLSTSGIEVTHRDIETTDEGLLTHAGVHVVIYIKDNTSSGFFGKLNRLHLSDCGTIKSMKEQGRYHRYISSERKDGLFLVDLRNERDVERKLVPCMNCLEKLKYKNFVRGNRWGGESKIIREFDVGEFFEQYATSFSEIPFHNDRNAPYSGYSKDHAKISRETREQRGWKCEICGVYLGVKEHQGYLHLHHMDGNKGNNKPSNLQCLCVLCHKQQDGHGGMPLGDSDKPLIDTLRRGQGLV